jgi:hypothetical protein
MQGGKVDDISCVVAVVVEEDVPEPEESAEEESTVDSGEAVTGEGTAEADGAAVEPAS